MSYIAKSKEIIDKRREEAGDFVEAIYQILGKPYSESNARKALHAIEQFIEIASKEEAEDKLAGTVLEHQTFGNGKQIKQMLLKVGALDNAAPDEILRIHGYDPLQFELVKHIKKAWNVYSKKDGVIDLVSSAITVKPLQNMLDENAVNAVFNKLQRTVKLERPEYKLNNKKLLVIPVMDLHLGKLSWARETGHDYDLEIAIEMYKNSIRELLGRIDKHGYEFDRILFQFGQDYYNTDNEKNQTTAGTPQDNSVRWIRMFEEGLELLIWTIEHLVQLAPVDVIYVPGNHDYKMSYSALKVIQAHYRNDKFVNVSNNVKFRQAYEFGNCMLAFTHKIAKNRIKHTIQAEFAEMWGRTKYRELNLGHFHSEGLEEIPGMKIRQHSSMVATDAWHHREGYVEVVRQMQSFIWDYNYGLENIYNIVVNQVWRKENEGINTDNI